MRTDPAPFWANLFVNIKKKQLVIKLNLNNRTKIRDFHSTKHLKDDLCTKYDVGEFRRTYT